MNLLELYKQLSDDEKKEFVNLIIDDINRIQKEVGRILLNCEKKEVHNVVGTSKNIPVTDVLIQISHDQQC